MTAWVLNGMINFEKNDNYLIVIVVFFLVIFPLFDIKKILKFNEMFWIKYTCSVKMLLKVLEVV